MKMNKLPKGYSFEYVPAIGCYCLFKQGKLIYKDWSFTITLNDLLRIIGQYE